MDRFQEARCVYETRELLAQQLFFGQAKQPLGGAIHEPDDRLRA